ncbi:hypothetical protein AAG570_009129 [Ranatra chinensis]|uniref:Uncharacterized protein n=1 Tax=Ranatra chinensis TaxID=642074 RepID=A0ABD0YSU9_9HEMI
MASKRRNTFYQSKKQGTTEIGGLTINGYFRQRGSISVRIAKMLACVFLAACLGAAVGLQEISIEAEVDKSLPAVNRALRDRGMSRVQVPDFGYEAAPVFINTFLSDLATLVRTGAAVMTPLDEGSISFRVDVGLTDALLDVELCPMMQGPFDWKLTSLEARLEFTLSKLPQVENAPCTTRWDKITITRLEGEAVHTADPKWNGKPMPAEIIQDIVERYNEVDNQPFVLKYLSEHLNVCTLVSPFLELILNLCQTFSQIEQISAKVVTFLELFVQGVTAVTAAGLTVIRLHSLNAENGNHVPEHTETSCEQELETTDIGGGFTVVKVVHLSTGRDFGVKETLSGGLLWCAVFEGPYLALAPGRSH